MSWIDPDKKLVHEAELLAWVTKEHIQVFGYNPSKTVHIRSGFIHKNSFRSTCPYELVINLAYGTSKQQGHVFLSEEDILHHWELYISQIDYNLFKTQQQQQEKERINNMHFSQIQKENYIVKVQFTRSRDNGHRYTFGSILPIISAFNKDNLYPTKYNYAVPFGLSLQIGDYVIIGNETDELHIAKVVEIIADNLKNMEEINKATKFIYGKVDISAISKQVVSAERAEYLKNKIDELKKTFEERKMLEIMAQNDPEAAKLIEEYKQLTLPVITKGE